MANVKIEDRVITPDGEVTTIGKLLDEDRAELVKYPNNWSRSAEKFIVQYRVFVKGTNSFWVIGQKAFESRAAKHGFRVNEVESY